MIFTQTPAIAESNQEFTLSPTIGSSLLLGDMNLDIQQDRQSQENAIIHLEFVLISSARKNADADELVSIQLKDASFGKCQVRSLRQIENHALEQLSFKKISFISDIVYNVQLPSYFTSPNTGDIKRLSTPQIYNDAIDSGNITTVDCIVKDAFKINNQLDGFREIIPFLYLYPFDSVETKMKLIFNNLVIFSHINLELNHGFSGVLNARGIGTFINSNLDTRNYYLEDPYGYAIPFASNNNFIIENKLSGNNFSGILKIAFALFIPTIAGTILSFLYLNENVNLFMVMIPLAALLVPLVLYYHGFVIENNLHSIVVFNGTTIFEVFLMIGLSLFFGQLTIAFMKKTKIMNPQ